MRLDKLTLKNFRGFAERSFEFQPQFNLIIGENGTGKTSVLKGAEVVLGVAFVGLEESALQRLRAAMNLS